jgi:hypothetical protein
MFGLHFLERDPLLSHQLCLIVTFKFSFSKFTSPLSTGVVDKKARSMHKMVEPLSFVDGAIWELIDSEPVVLIVLPLPFVD